jgi:hypothetical protein
LFGAFRPVGLQRQAANAQSVRIRAIFGSGPADISQITRQKTLHIRPERDGLRNAFVIAWG